jgi:DNA helicase-2/ATP-dependent DNA helicase PcrA
LKKAPRTIVLATNYRSRKKVVEFFNSFMTHECCDWRKTPRSRQLYRVDKKISANRKDREVAVIASTPGHPTDVCSEIAHLVRSIIDQKKVDDPNQIAFLFPSLKSSQVERMQEALEEVDLQVYAPRAGTFLEVPESVAMFGLIAKVFGTPERAELPGSDYNNYHDWLEEADAEADKLTQRDRSLAKYVRDRNAEVQKVVADYESLLEVADDHEWPMDAPYDPNVMRQPLIQAAGLSAQTKKSLGSPYFDRFVRRRVAEGKKPFRLSYVINRATSLDWSLLDLFYQLCGFKHFRDMFDLAETGQDEGPVCNLSLISSYLDRFMDQYGAIVSGQFLSDNRFVNVLFGGYLYALYRRGESEYEDAEDPFPRGRIPFITIHQAKGLEFPVVVLGNPRKDSKTPQAVEQIVQPLLQRKGEPLDRIAEFDIMRMFYVAISRAKNLLVVAHYKGQGQRINSPFNELFDNGVTRIPEFSVDSMPRAELVENDDYRSYSYTGDYLLYKKCPRQYMLFRRYGFVPSRSQTMLFGRLVHETLEDLHQHLIAQKAEQ